MREMQSQVGAEEADLEQSCRALPRLRSAVRDAATIPCSKRVPCPYSPSRGHCCGLDACESIALADSHGPVPPQGRRGIDSEYMAAPGRRKSLQTWLVLDADRLLLKDDAFLFK